jgi:phosphoribosylanthranilate isomerase
MFRVKICGVTCSQDALAAVAAGADAVGLNFCPASKRRVALEQAVEIAKALPPEVMVVGVFVNADVATIREVYADVRLDLVQLHGDEPPEFLRSLRTSELADVPVMRALKCGGSLALVSDYLNRCRDLACLPRLVLLDAAVLGAHGGTGVACDWATAAEYHRLQDAPPLVLAGGLTADNVLAAVTAVRPAAVDVATGVEISPGRKDAAQVRQFVSAATAALDSISSAPRASSAGNQQPRALP